MPGRMRHQNMVAPSERFAEVHVVRRAGTVSMLIQLGSGRRALSQLMPRHMVRVRMRDEASRLPAAHIDA